MTLSWNPAAACATSLVGKWDAPEETIGEVFLIKKSGGIGGRGKGEVHSQRRVTRHAISRGTQGTSSLTVVDVSHHLAHLLMPAAHLVSHLHLRQVEVLGALPQLFQCHGVLDEGRVGNVGRWKPEAHVRTLRLLLVGTLGLHLSLPVYEFLELNFIMFAKRSHDSLYKMAQLRLSDARRTYQMPHLAAHFIKFVVAIHESYVREMGCQGRNCHRNEHFSHVF